MMNKLYVWSVGNYLGHDFRGRTYYEQTKMQKVVYKMFALYYSRKHRKLLRKLSNTF